uniref:Uncharacterized protein n=1 Tax=Canis lupus familiaris TaxID=9615 RepID=A0A8C0Q1L8_CANLF
MSRAILSLRPSRILPCLFLASGDSWQSLAFLGLRLHHSSLSLCFLYGLLPVKINSICLKNELI